MTGPAGRTVFPGDFSYPATHVYCLVRMSTTLIRMFSSTSLLHNGCAAQPLDAK
jgi:hypothetical protein